MKKTIAKKLDKADSKLDTYTSRVPFVGKKFAALSGGVTLAIIVGVAFAIIVT